MKVRNIIVGAGISGLALGWFLNKQLTVNHDLVILEAGERPGGWIRSARDQGFLFEEGPRSCRSKGAGLATLQLIEELGLCDEVIGASPEANKRFIYWDGKLQAVPDTFLSFLLSPLMKGVLPALWREWRVSPSHLKDESIAGFIGRRLSGEIAVRLMDPLVSGIYAGDIAKLSMRSCFPVLYQMEQEHGSLVKGMLRKTKTEEINSPFVQAMLKNSIFSFKNGMETLISALYGRLKEKVRLSTEVKSLYQGKDGIEVELKNGQMLKGDHVYLAVPAHAASRLLKTIDADASEEMSKVSHATVAVVNMGWNDKVLKYDGFGYLVPSSQKQDVLGVVFDSSAFATQNTHAGQTRLTAMLGGMHQPEVQTFSLEEIKGKALQAIHRHLGITAKPEAVRVTVARQAIPQYEVGHQMRINNIERRLKLASNSRISLLGSAWRGVAVNDCIAESKELASS